MARTVRDAKLENGTARSKLKSGDEIHFRTLIPGQVHLGYRRRQSGMPGNWIVRIYDKLAPGEKGSPYKKIVLGSADDVQEADGETVLTFAQAQKLAYEKAESAERTTETNGTGAGRSRQAKAADREAGS